MTEEEHEDMILGMIQELAEAGKLPPFPVPNSVLARAAVEMAQNRFIADRIFACPRS